MKQLVIYDLDGTLIDTGEDIVRAANHMRRALGYAEITREEIYPRIGWGLHDLIRRLLETKDAKLVEKGARIYRAHYHAHMMDHSRVYPGGLECLEYFKTRGRCQALVTNKPNPYAVEMLEKLSVETYFSEIVPGNGLYPKKPDPGAAQAMMKRFSIQPEQAVMIGDSLIDLEMGRRAGMSCLLLSHGFVDKETLRQANPDGLFDDFYELLKFVKKNDW